MNDSHSERHPVEELAEDFLDRFRRGERPALSEYTRKHPDLAEEIRELFPALVMLEDVGPPAGSASVQGNPVHFRDAAKLERLGDYRILREVGRGGMGIVYEAEQESLGRHVALKVLGTSVLLDSRHLQRFQREARAAARLHHTNIVPVFGVGEHEGLHYYVMQFIHGQGLDQVLAELAWLRQTSSGAVAGMKPSATAVVAPEAAQRREDAASAVLVAKSLLTGVFASPPTDTPAGDNQADELTPNPSPAFATTQGRSDSDVRWPGQTAKKPLSDSSRQYWQSVARIGIQVADALAYAHAQNTLHRDIKPANLLLDTQGVVWVTDFGLAKANDSENLTNTGDVVGTLRYMAPERFSGKGDARSDIYALGLTLYELLTLRPAFAASERSTLAHQVMHMDPARPRKLNPAVPRDLETIVLKAISRDPAHRYQNATEMAEDLKRFTDDKPIRARPVSEVEKLWRWCRRNPAVAVLASAVVLTLLFGSAGIAWKWREAEQGRQDADNERQKVVSAQNDTQRVLAGVMLDKGVALAEQREIGEGLFWMLEGLRVAPPEAQDLRRAIRTNLATWLEQSHGFVHVLEHPAVEWAAFTPDGARLLTASENEVWSWDLATGQRIGSLVKRSRLNRCALSADGAMLVTASRPEKGEPAMVERWDARTGQALGASWPHPLDVTAIAFLPGNLVATGCRDGIVRSWDAGTGRFIGEVLKDDKNAVTALAVSPGGKGLAIGQSRRNVDDESCTVVLWDLSAGQAIGEQQTHRGILRSLAFSPDGKKVVTASTDSTVQILDAVTGLALAAPLRHPNEVWSARYTPDGRAIVTAGKDGIVRWWDVARGSELIGALSLHKKPLACVALSADGTLMASASSWGGQSGLIDVIRLAQPLSRPVATNKHGLLKATWMAAESETWFSRHFASFSPDATRVLTGGNHHLGFLWDTSTGQPALCPGGPGGPFWNTWRGVNVTAYSPDGSLLATSSRNESVVGEARLWNAASGSPVGPPLVHLNHIATMAFSPDSKVLATGGYDAAVHFWNTATGQRQGVPLPQVDIVISLAYSPDGKTLAVGHAGDRSGATGVVLWDLANRQRLGQPMPGPSMLLRFSPNGQFLVGAVGPEMRIWEARTGQLVAGPVVEMAAINCIELSRDGQTLLVATTDGTLRLREMPSGKALGGPMLSPVLAKVAAFSPDPQGQLLLVGYGDGSARLWDRATQKPLGPPVVQSSPLMALTFTPDGNHFLTTAADASTRRWPIPTPTADDWERLELLLEVRTGLHMGDGQVVVTLSPGEWQKRRHKLAALDASLVSNSKPGVGNAAFHDARARDAEQDNDPFAARWHLDRMIEAHDPSAHSWLTYARRARTWAAQGQFMAAAADYDHALKLGSPAALMSWYRQCAADCQEGQQWSTALWYLHRAVTADPEDWRLYAARAVVWGKLGKTEERDADVAQIVERSPDSMVLVQLADDYAAAGRWDKAAKALSQAFARGPCPPVAWHRQGLACLKVGDLAAYRQFCGKLLEQEGATTNGANANSIAWVCALGPGAVGDYKRPIELAEIAVSKTRPASRHGVLNTLGAILYRAGRHREAVARLLEGIKLSGGDGNIDDWLFLAMAYHHLGEVDKARKYLALANAQRLPETGLSWDALEADLLRREARALVDAR